MFTGIITHIGIVKQVVTHANDISVTFKTQKDFCKNLSLGDSVAVDGVCLTVVDFTEEGFTADISSETLSCTTFNQICEGLNVNLERCLTLSTPIGGHLLSGHVHGVGVIRTIYQEGRAKIFTIDMPEQLMKYFAPKGTVSLNGISLTVNGISNQSIKISCIPHTLEKTSLQYKQPGDRINIEVDMVILYLDRLLTTNNSENVRLIDLALLQRIVGISRTEH